MSTATREKPLVFADERPDTDRFDPTLHRGHLDPSRIPGYSEIVMANDIARADALEFRRANGVTQEEMYRRISATPQALDVEFAWLPISAANGGSITPAQARVLDRYQDQEGFRLATEEDLTSRGFGFPPLGRRAEDGTIRRGADTALYVRSGEVARKWEAFRIAESREAEGAPFVAPGAPGAWHAKGETETVTLKS